MGDAAFAALGLRGLGLRGLALAELGLRKLGGGWGDARNEGGAVSCGCNRRQDRSVIDRDRASISSAPAELARSENQTSMHAETCTESETSNSWARSLRTAPRR